MARRSVCETISDMVMRDFRLLALPPVARLLWHNLLMAMRFAGVSALRSGERPLDADALAIVAAISVSEIEQHLDALVRCGLLERAADGAIGSPMLAASTSRAEINRANALAGVAKRRAARATPGQRELPILHPVGGAPSVSEIGEQTAVQTGEPAPPGDPAKLKLEDSKLKLAVPDDVFRSAGEAAMAAAGFDPARWAGNYGIVRQWLADGADEALIVRVLRDKTHAGVKHLGYFKQAIAEALQRQDNEPCDLSTLPEASWRFTIACQEWLQNGAVGPQPQPADFRPGGFRAVAA